MAGRSAIRGCESFNTGHSFEPFFMQFLGHGVRSDVMPCDDRSFYWFSHKPLQKELEGHPAKMREYVMSKLEIVPDKVRHVIESIEMGACLSSPLRYRLPWELLWGNISKDNVCVTGDALHPMTPDLGQGGHVALEDGVVLARCLGEVLLKSKSHKGKAKSEEGEEEYKNIEKGLKKYASERRWRSIDIVATAYVVGFIQGSDGKIISILRDKFLAPIMAGLLLKKAKYDCGKLNFLRFNFMYTSHAIYRC